jgi:ERI1 exoribonuclease 3
MSSTSANSERQLISQTEKMTTTDSSTKKKKIHYLCVLDFEATCEKEPKPAPDPQEIIEFPSVLLAKEINEESTDSNVDGEEDAANEWKTVSTFESFVRPVFHPILTKFCTELTTIVQSDVDQAETFPIVFAKHSKWLQENGVFEPNASLMIVTCGDWDLRKMLPIQLKASNIPLKSIPSCYHRWINIKFRFQEALDSKDRVGMDGMLRKLGLTLDGTHHRGIDDCKNIAKIAIVLDKRFDVDFLTPTTERKRL